MTDILATVLGLIGAGLMLASYLMKSMLPLRIAALSACCFLVAYGALKQALPTLLLYGVLIPINIKKTLQMRQLVKAIEKARDDTPVSEWLLPHMHRHTVPAGKRLWTQGDAATEMLYLDSGSLRLVEYDELLPPGSLVGEIGLFAQDNRRTLSLEAATDCVVYSLSAEEMALLAKLGREVPEGSEDDGLSATIYRLRRRIERATPALVPLQSKSRVGYVFRAPLTLV